MSVEEANGSGTEMSVSALTEFSDIHCVKWVMPKVNLRLSSVTSVCSAPSADWR